MACGHCVASVTEEIERIPGVTAVTVDVQNDHVTITSKHPLDPKDVHTAVEQAGYELTTGHGGSGSRGETA